jgi:hypothetical protein
VTDANPEIELSDITFEHSEEEAFKQGAKQKALDDVLEQKQFYEKNLGVRLIAVGFRDASVGQGPTPGARVVEEVVVTVSDRWCRRKSATMLRMKPHLSTKLNTRRGSQWILAWKLDLNEDLKSLAYVLFLRMKEFPNSETTPSRQYQ